MHLQISGEMQMVSDPIRRQKLVPWPGSLAGLEQVLRAAHKVDRDMPVGWLLLLLGVAKFQHIEQGISARELADRMSFPYPTVSEVVKKMTTPSRRFPAATGLILQERSYLDARRKQLVLSARGERLVAGMAHALEIERLRGELEKE